MLGECYGHVIIVSTSPCAEEGGQPCEFQANSVWDGVDDSTGYVDRLVPPVGTSQEHRPGVAGARADRRQGRAELLSHCLRSARSNQTVRKRRSDSRFESLGLRIAGAPYFERLPVALCRTSSDAADYPESRSVHFGGTRVGPAAANRTASTGSRMRCAIVPCSGRTKPDSTMRSMNANKSSK